MCREGAWAELTVCVPSMGELPKQGARTNKSGIVGDCRRRSLFLCIFCVGDCCKPAVLSMYRNLGLLLRSLRACSLGVVLVKVARGFYTWREPPVCSNPYLRFAFFNFLTGSVPRGDVFCQTKYCNRSDDNQSVLLRMYPLRNSDAILPLHPTILCR